MEKQRMKRLVEYISVDDLRRAAAEAGQRALHWRQMGAKQVARITIVVEGIGPLLVGGARYSARRGAR
jgi:hypothetical protein